MSWNTLGTQSPGQPATAAWANLVSGNFIQTAAVIPAVTGGLTGATSTGRFVGFVNGNSPSTGTFAAGDFAFDVSVINPRIWACVSAGSPGGWGQIGAAVPTGTVVAYLSGVISPPGWVLADGRLLGRNASLALYNVLIAVSGLDPWGTGDGSTTFAIPDLRGRTVVAANSMGTDAGASGRLTVNNVLGNGGGTETKTLTQTELPAHAHTGTAADHVHGIPGGGGQSGQGLAPNSQGSTFQSGASGALGLTINATGAGAAYNQMPPYGVANWIIKL